MEKNLGTLVDWKNTVLLAFLVTGMFSEVVGNSSEVVGRLEIPNNAVTIFKPSKLLHNDRTSSSSSSSPPSPSSSSSNIIHQEDNVKMWTPLLTPLTFLFIKELFTATQSPSHWSSLSSASSSASVNNLKPTQLLQLTDQVTTNTTTDGVSRSKNSKNNTSNKSNKSSNKHSRSNSKNISIEKNLKILININNINNNNNNNNINIIIDNMSNGNIINNNLQHRDFTIERRTPKQKRSNNHKHDPRDSSSSSSSSSPPQPSSSPPPPSSSSSLPSSSSVNTTETVDAISNSYTVLAYWVGITVPSLFGFIAVFGLVGNLMVIISVLLNRQMRHTTNLLIIHLALADLLFIVFCVPFTAVSYAIPVWPFGQVWCQVRWLNWLRNDQLIN